MILPAPVFFLNIFVVVVQSLSSVLTLWSPWTAAHQAFLSFLVSQSLSKLISIEMVMPSNDLILCCPLLLLPSIFPSIRFLMVVLKLWCWRRLLTVPSSEEIKSVNPKANQPWIFTGRTDAEAPILWLPDAKNQFIGKDPDAGKDWRRGDKKVAEEEMVR